MEGSLFKSFDRVRVINLPERSDRRRAMTQELARLGYIATQETFFPAIKMTEAGPFPSPGAHGCYRSHERVISDAANAGESLLLLEDDCAFHSAAKSFEVPACDILWGGWNTMDDDGDFIIGAHCLGFSRATVKRLHEYLNSFLASPPDAKAMTEPGFKAEIRPGIDGVYVWFRRAYPHLETCFANLAYQRPSRSDITPGKLDKMPVFKAITGFLRSTRQVLRRRD